MVEVRLNAEGDTWTSEDVISELLPIEVPELKLTRRIGLTHN